MRKRPISASPIGKTALITVLLAALLSSSASGVAAEQKVRLRVPGLPRRGDTSLVALVRLAQYETFLRRNPDIEVVSPTKLHMPGELHEGLELMSIAGDSAPDVLSLYVRKVQNFIDQGFIYDLEPLIEQELKADPDFVARLGTPEFLWPVVTKDGRRYALIKDYYLRNMIYRKDLMREAGIDPPRAPKDWDELYDFARRMTRPDREIPQAEKVDGQWGLRLMWGSFAGWLFTDFVWQAGGDMIRQFKTCPRCGAEHEAVKEKELLRCGDCGGELASMAPEWRLTYGDEAGAEALRFYKKLRWSKWARCPHDDEPVDVPTVVCPTCREPNPVLPDPGGGKKPDRMACRVDGTSLEVPAAKKRFVCPLDGTFLDGEKIHTGVVEMQEQGLTDFEAGSVGMAGHTSIHDAVRHLETVGLRGADIGFAPWPAGPGGRASFVGGNALGINRNVKDPRVMDAAWRLIKFMCSENARRIETRVKVENGFALYSDPRDLKRFGYDEYYEQFSPELVRVYDEIDRIGRVEPFVANYQIVQAVQLTEPVDTILKLADGYRYDPAVLMRENERKSNTAVMKVREESLHGKRQRVAWFFFVLAVPLGALLIRAVLRGHAEKLAKEEVVPPARRRLRVRLRIWCFLGPAVVLVLVWQYLPLFRGSVMAFFDYRIMAQSLYLGLDNFIEAATSGLFWRVMGNTVIYVAMTLGFGFLVPIILAVMLSETPVGKMFFRTVFYLPTVISGIVIMLLWKVIYQASDDGLLNRLLAALNEITMRVGWQIYDRPIDWLGENALLAMACVVIPGVWSGAGAGSILYLAALKTVPEDLYESVALDGGGVVQRIRHIMIPFLLPLIVINFIGALIGSFHAMANIFVMTGGGPVNGTRVIGLEIWANAFVFLKIGYATAQAWILGAMLIGLTLMQMQILKRVEFRAGEAN